MEPQKERHESCLPIVERGCCCDLKTCCKVQGWMLIIGSSISIIRCIMQLFTIASLCSALAEESTNCFTDEQVSSNVYIAISVVIINCIIQIIFLVTAALFLQGINQGKHEKMVHYIRLMWVQIVLSIIVIITAAVIATPVVLLAFIFMGIPIYCLICANSLHLQMQADRSGQNCMKQMA